MLNLASKKILVTGAHGFLGSFVIETLLARGVPKEKLIMPRSSEYDLERPEETRRLIKETKPELVIHLAARVGGIGYNRKYPAEIFYKNLVMGTHLMHEAWQGGVEKFVAIGTICSYPKFTPVPFKEEDLWNGYPEETNAPYGLAKKMLLVLSQSYRAQYGWNAITLLPVNLYGPRDHFDPEDSHVIPALIRKIDEAKRENRPFVEVWGTGTPTREFIYVADAAEGIVRAAERYDAPEPVNIGSGMEISIKDLTATIARLIGYTGEVRYDPSRPDGQPRRSLDTAKAEALFGFKAKTPFEEGLKRTIEWWQNNKENPKSK